MMPLLSTLRSVYLAIGLTVLTLTSFGLCSIARVVFGHRVAKRLHEVILGYGTFYWMRAIGAWNLKIKGKNPDLNQTYVVVANHASK